MYIDSNIIFIIFYFQILFIFTETGWKGEREEEKHHCVRDAMMGGFLHAPNWGPGPQPRHVP